MVGRRQLRENLLKTLYAQSKNPLSDKVAMNNMMQSLEKIYELYALQLNLLLSLRQVAQEKLDIAKNKNLKSENDSSPNTKFVENQIFEKLEGNTQLQEFNKKNKQSSWADQMQYPEGIFKKVKGSPIYEEYTQNPNRSFEEDKEFIQKLFDKYIAKNASLNELYEEKDIAWADDYHIANSMTFKTLKFIEENKDFNTLLSIFKGNDDKEFVTELYNKVKENEKELDEKIEERLLNWELDRIADIDKIILQMAIAELEYFPEIPPRVVINEYIELAKTFSTPSSNVFINGILDNYIKNNKSVK